MIRRIVVLSSLLSALMGIFLMPKTFALTTVTTTTYTFLQPTGNSLNFWEFPLMFLGGFAFVFGMVALIFERENLVTMFFLGLMVGLFIAFEAGLVNFAFIILGMASFLIYAIWGMRTQQLGENE